MNKDAEFEIFKGMEEVYRKENEKEERVIGSLISKTIRPDEEVIDCYWCEGAGSFSVDNGLYSQDENCDYCVGCGVLIVTKNRRCRNVKGRLVGAVSQIA